MGPVVVNRRDGGARQSREAMLSDEARREWGRQATELANTGPGVILVNRSAWRALRRAADDERRCADTGPEV